ncbi:MAG: hypothetical protein GF365_05165, partial [Candidatus Buchananbacteria bacterium]|nr:hypothetical protein [Candidatus Buchananbacteria bacterium]
MATVGRRKMKRKDKLELFHKLPNVHVPGGDAREEDLEKVLDWPVGVWAISDLEEIKARQEVFKYLLENLESFDQVFAHWERHGNFTIPTNNNSSFLSYQQNLSAKNTEFWCWLEQKLLPNLPQRDKLPDRLERAVEVIEQEKNEYYQEEVELTEAMMDDLTRSIVIEGIVNINITKPGHRNREFSWEEKLCCGVNLYLSDPEKVYQSYQAPKWTGWLGRYYAQKVNKRKERQQHKGSRIESIPAPIMLDILNHFTQICQARQEFFNNFNYLCLEVYYVYDKKGLRVRVLDYSYNASGFTTHNKRDVDPPDFRGLENTAIEHRISLHLVASLNKNGKNARYRQLESGMQNYLELKTIDARETSAHYRTMLFAEVVEKYRTHLDLINNWRQKVMDLFKELYSYYQVIKRINDMSQKYSLPLVMPEVSDQGNLLEISRFAPVRLGEKREIQPFSQFSVNGKMLNLTGRNGSGKTTILLAILDLCLMAQCGLPVFAESAKLSIKRYFLLSFLERVSDDSTFKAKLRKDMEVVTKIKKLLPPQRENVLAIVDELGSATTEGSVMSVVKPFATWLNQAGVSAVLSTQIPELSYYMAEQLGVKNFKITSGFTLEEGIGEGEPDEVAKEMGFF